MAYLMYRLTPPRSDSKAFLITPAEFFQSPAVMESTKRKAQSDDLGLESTKRLQYDPSHEEGDKTVSGYLHQINKQLSSDRDKTLVKIPLHEQLESLDEYKDLKDSNDYQTRLKNNMEALNRNQALLEKRILELGKNNIRIRKNQAALQEL